MKKFVLLYSVLVFSVSCKLSPNTQSNTQKHKKVQLFNVQQFITEQINLLPDSIRIEKVVTINGAKEDKTYNPKNLQQDLKIFDSNIDEKNIGQYTIDTLFNDQKGIEKIVYGAKEKALRTQKMEMYYNNDVLVRLDILLESENMITTNQKILSFKAKNGFSIYDKRKTILSNPQTLAVDVTFVY